MLRLINFCFYRKIDLSPVICHSLMDQLRTVYLSVCIYTYTESTWYV